MRFLHRLLPSLALIVAGVVSVFAFAPYRLYWIMPLSLAALVAVIQFRPQRAFRYGWLWGLATYTANFYWIYYSLHDIAGLTAWLAVPLVLLLPAYLALFPALAVWLTGRLTRRPEEDAQQTRVLLLRWLVVFPALWTLTEWVRGWLLTGFSWGEIGYSQITESPLAGYAPLLGVHGVTVAPDAPTLGGAFQPCDFATTMPLDVGVLQLCCHQLCGAQPARLRVPQCGSVGGQTGGNQGVGAGRTAPFLPGFGPRIAREQATFALYAVF